MADSDLPDDQQHRYDVFTVGDEIPWRDDTATVIEREVVADLPDDVPDYAVGYSSDPPHVDDDTDYVLVTVEFDGDTVGPMTACHLARETEERFTPHGLPDVRAAATGSIGLETRTTVQTPATGGNVLSDGDTAALATFLRKHADFTPLHALLGDVDSSEEMEELADALDRAALAREYSDRIESYDA